MAGPTLIQLKRTTVADREANTVTLPTIAELGVNLTDGRLWCANSTDVFEIGANTKNCRISNAAYIGNSSVNTTVNSSQINVTTLQALSTVFVGANVDITTSTLFIGNTSVNNTITSSGIALDVSPTANLTANSVIISLANSTGTANLTPTTLLVPNITMTGNLSANGATGVSQALLSNSTGGVYWGTAGGGSQTPWIADIDAAGYDLSGANSIYVGANNFINTTAVGAGNGYFTGLINAATVQTGATFVANSTQLTITGKFSANGGLGNSSTFLGSNSTGGAYWAIPTAVAAAGGSNTEIQYNDSTVIAGSPGFTFDNTTNNVTIANTLISASALNISNTVANITANSILISITNSTSTANLQPGVLTVGTTIANTIGVYAATVNAASHTVGTAFTANSTLTNTVALIVGGNFVANATIANSVAFTTAIVTANATVLAVGANNIINTTAVGAGNAYFTGTVNAASYTGTGFTANSTGVYGGVINGSSHSVSTSFTANSTLTNTVALVVGANFVANSLGAYHTAIMNAATHSSGATFTANATLVNCAAINLSGQINVGANSIISNSVISSGGSLLSANIQINPQTGTSYTLAAADSGKIVTMNNAGAMTVTVPAGLPIGFRCQVLRLGAGTCTLSNTGQTGCTILSRTAAFAITGQYGSASVFQTATANTYIVDGLI